MVKYEAVRDYCSHFHLPHLTEPVLTVRLMSVTSFLPCLVLTWLACTGPDADPLTLALECEILINTTDETSASNCLFIDCTWSSVCGLSSGTLV